MLQFVELEALKNSRESNNETVKRDLMRGKTARLLLLYLTIFCIVYIYIYSCIFILNKAFTYCESLGQQKLFSCGVIKRKI